MNKVEVIKSTSRVGISLYTLIHSVSINGTKIEFTNADSCDYDATTGTVNLKFGADFVSIEKEAK